MIPSVLLLTNFLVIVGMAFRLEQSTKIRQITKRMELIAGQKMYIEF